MQMVFIRPHDNGTTAGRHVCDWHMMYISATVMQWSGLIEQAYLNSAVVGTVETGRVAVTSAFTAHANAENRYKLR
jgi:hypothetical protein